jgi:hypothetical protein
MAEGRAIWDSRQLEYERIDNALRARMNYTQVRNVNLLIQQPQALLQMIELDWDIWDCLRPYFIGDKRRDGIDGELNLLSTEANTIFDSLYTLSEDNQRVLRGDMIEADVNRIKDFMGREKDVYRLMMDLRHEKGLDIGFLHEASTKERAAAFKTIAKGGFDE